MRQMTAILLAVILVFPLCGCSAWMDGSYVSVVPHEPEAVSEKKEIEDAFSYLDLRNALIGMVESSTQNAVFAVSLLDMKFADYYMDVAIAYIKESYALGAYTVSDITYEFGTNQGNHVVAVDITYNQRRSAILRMKQISDMDGAEALVLSSLNNHENSVVFMVDQYDDTDFVALVNGYVSSNPEQAIDLIQTDVSVYPQTGQQRIVEIAFTYNDR